LKPFMIASAVATVVIALTATAVLAVLTASRGQEAGLQHAKHPPYVTSTR
jgi:hypothetical protein